VLYASRAALKRAATLLVAGSLVACMPSGASAGDIVARAASPRSGAWRFGGETVLAFAAVAVAAWLLGDARKLHARSPGARPSVASAPWYRYLNPMAPLYDLYVHRELLHQFVRRDILGRYRGSHLGILWSLVNPLMMLGIYTFVFSTIFKARWRLEGEITQGEFAVTLFAGLIAYNVFSESVNRAPTLIVSNVNYVKKVVFPLQILPVSAFGAALFHGLISVVILMIGNLVLLGAVSWRVALLPLAAIPLIELSLGISWLLASLGVYLRDISYAVAILTQILIFLTPVFYRIDAVPEGLRPLMHANPLSEVVESFRRTLVWNQTPDWTAWLGVTLVSGAIFSLGYAWFMKTRSGFADVV